jgi:hypothetical protein
MGADGKCAATSDAKGPTRITKGLVRTTKDRIDHRPPEAGSQSRSCKRARLRSVDADQCWTLVECARVSAEPIIATKDHGKDAGGPIAQELVRSLSPTGTLMRGVDQSVR